MTEMVEDGTGARLRAVFARELDLEPGEVTDDLAYGATPEWDSVAHMHLVAAIEETFDLAFDDDEIGELNTFARMRDAVARRVA